MDIIGIDESQIQEEMCKTCPQCTVIRLKRGDNTPMEILKLSCVSRCFITALYKQCMFCVVHTYLTNEKQLDINAIVHVTL